MSKFTIIISLCPFLSFCVYSFSGVHFVFLSCPSLSLHLGFSSLFFFFLSFPFRLLFVPVNPNHVTGPTDSRSCRGYPPVPDVQQTQEDVKGTTDRSRLTTWSRHVRLLLVGQRSVQTSGQPADTLTLSTDDAC